MRYTLIIGLALALTPQCKPQQQRKDDDGDDGVLGKGLHKAVGDPAADVLDPIQFEFRRPGSGGCAGQRGPCLGGLPERPEGISRSECRGEGDSDRQGDGCIDHRHDQHLESAFESDLGRVDRVKDGCKKQGYGQGLDELDDPLRDFSKNRGCGRGPGSDGQAQAECNDQVAHCRGPVMVGALEAGLGADPEAGTKTLIPIPKGEPSGARAN